MSFSCQKREFDRFFNRLDQPVEDSRPDRPVDPTGAGRPGRFPSLLQTIDWKLTFFNWEASAYVPCAGLCNLNCV